MEIILNRLRGTGNIFTFSRFKITGLIIYALYIFGLVFIFSTYYYAILASILFLIGESFAFGKWVGFLVDYDNKHIPEYDSKVGKSFPYIHYMANSIVKEKEDYLNYCRFALTLRGFIWWTPILTLLHYIDLISWYMLILNSIVLSFGFPFACYVGRNWTFEYKSKYFFTKQGWENQEIAYGAIQFLCVTFSVFLFAIIK